jgi:hypothetical protein
MALWRNHCCDGNTTVRSLCIVDLHVAVKTVECCHSNQGLIPPCAVVLLKNLLLSPIQMYGGRNVKCLDRVS